MFLIVLTVPRMWQRGMFLDGMVYASVARNMAAGDGSVWAPSHTATDGAPFFEHPPLGFALEALGFRILGDSFLVERGFSLLVFGLHALLIMAIWRRLLPARYDWLPIFFWILPSMVTWAVINNMLENTQALFTSAAVYCLIGACGESSVRTEPGFSIFAGVCVVAATLTKGPVGLFPMAVPLLLLLLPRAQPHRIGMVWILMASVVAAAAVALAAFDGPRHELTEYVGRQLFPSLQGQREVANSKFEIVRHLVGGIVARMAPIVATLWWIRLRSGQVMPRIHPVAWFFLSIGLAASLPIAVSPKMMGHYFVPSVPFFALAAAAFALPAIDIFDRPARRSWSTRMPLILAAGLLATAIGVVAVHGTLEPRERDTVASLDAIAGAIPLGATIGTCRTSQYDWGLQTYLQRFFRVALDARDAPVDGWFLQSANGTCAAPTECRLVAEGRTLALYRCGGALVQ